MLDMAMQRLLEARRCSSQTASTRDRCHCATDGAGRRAGVQRLRFSRRSQLSCSLSSSGSSSSSSRHTPPHREPLSTGCTLQRRPNPPARLHTTDRASVSVEPLPPQLASNPFSSNGNGKIAIVSPSSEGFEALKYSVTEFVAETLLPTRSGRFRLRGYRHSVDGGRTFTEPSAIITGNPEGQEEVAVRVHDACFTSEVLGSLKCDCADQLKLAMAHLQTCPPGIIIYLQQEGRGIGLANKIAAYALQEKGLDTVDANRALGLPDDCREYTSVHNILADLGVRSIRLMTNNPRKSKVLRELGVAVTGRIPCIVQAQPLAEAYLAVKQSRMQHDLDGSYCFWNHDGEPLPPTAASQDMVFSSAASSSDDG